MSGLTEQERAEVSLYLAAKKDYHERGMAAVERIVAERERAARDEWSQRYRELVDASLLVEAALVREREAVAERERAAQVRALRETADALEGALGVPGSPRNLYEFRIWLRDRADRLKGGDQ